MKRYKENQKEEEKLALRTVEVSVTLRSDRKRALNEAKADISGKRQRKVSVRVLVSHSITRTACF